MKAWYPDIERHVAKWSARLVSSGLEWWPRYVYHFTDVRNAAKIIKAGCLYSRAEAERRGLMQVDNASPSVVGVTPHSHLEYVRLYFRPRTPTQYRNEGIRPTEQRELGGAHCPVPVFFCFDAVSILSRDDCEYSDGNMATTRAKHGGDRSFFLNIPFDLVYSDGPILQEQDKAEITFRRNAEALVANCLPIGDSLKAILCRSVAERQTLLSLLPSEFYRWSTLIRVPDQHFYYRQWTYVEKISVMDDILTFWFNPSSRTPGPFKGYFVYEEFESGVKREWNGTIPDTRSRWSIRLAGAEMGNAELWLDGCLAFSGSVTFIELPF